MASRLPSLSALRAFEAAARHESFKEAAAELAVTPVAVTRQIKALEHELGLRLFDRLHRRVVLTEGGLELLADMALAFQAMHRGVERARQRAGLRRLAIGVDDTFAARWLVPRLEGFRRQHPNVEIELRHQEDNEVELDGTIYYGEVLYPSANRHVLFTETVFPVCSPALAAGPPPLRAPADLARHRLLHEGSGIDWWRRWLEAASLRDIEIGDGVVFPSSNKAYDAAVAGEGAIIGDDIITADDLAAGRLVRLFETTFPGGTYAIVVRDARGDVALSAFVDWLRAAGRAHKQRMKDLLRL